MIATRLIQCLVLLLAGCCFFLFAGAVSAAEGQVPILQASIFYEFAGDRSRMIQLSLVFVGVGCALIWWYR